MHDATGKPEAGRIDGNYYYEGDFQECDRIQEKIPHPDPVKGLYCTTLWYRLVSNIRFEMQGSMLGSYDVLFNSQGYSHRPLSIATCATKTHRIKTTFD